MNLQKRVLKLAGKYDFTYELLWDQDLNFAISCNDFFGPAADAEEIETVEDVLLLEQSLKDSPRDGHMLYCARRRKQKPMKGNYKYLEEKTWKLFDECEEN